MNCILNALTLFWMKQIAIVNIPLWGLHLQGQGEVTCFSVPDDAGGHGRLASPAPLQVAHSVLVQVASHHCRSTGPHATRRELQSPLGSHKATRHKFIWDSPKLDFTYHTQTDTYHRAVTLRNTFIPNKGPLMSPAPNSSLRHTQRRTSEPDHHKTWRCVGMSLTSPQPLAEVTRRTQRFIFPPPLPLCVDRDPERIAVSEVVRGACQT